MILENTTTDRRISVIIPADFCAEGDLARIVGVEAETFEEPGLVLEPPPDSARLDPA